MLQLQLYCWAVVAVSYTHLATANVTKFEAELYPYIEAKYPEIFEQIRTKKVLDKEVEEILHKALKDFKATFAAN